MKISHLLTSFGLAVGVGILMSTAIQIYTLDHLRINGPEYKKIELGTDLVADILPPPLYVVEPYAIATEGMFHEEMGKTAAEKLKKLHAAYDERRQYWAGSALPSSLKNQLDGDVEIYGAEFWNVIDAKVIPAFSSTDPNIRSAALDALKDAFWKHDNAVRAFIPEASAYLEASKQGADVSNERLTLLADAAVIVAFLILTIGVLYFRRSAIRPLVGMTAYMSDLATGDYAKEVPFVGRRDEIGGMAEAVEVFRQNAIANVRLEGEAATSRSQQDAERAEVQRRMQTEAEQLHFASDNLASGLKRLAAGDLAFQISEPFAPAFEPLRLDFNQSVRQLGIALSTIAASIGMMDNGTREIAAGTQDLSKRTEQQAASLEETAAALDEIVANVASSTKLTEEARAVAAQANQSAQQSAEVVSHAEGAMRRIEKSSQQISNIIGVIDDIAFQTNLLALNAGVEAARAEKRARGLPL